MFFKIDYSKLPKLKLYLETKLGNLLANHVSLLTKKKKSSPRTRKITSELSGGAMPTLSDSWLNKTAHQISCILIQQLSLMTVLKIYNQLHIFMVVHLIIIGMAKILCVACIN